MSPNELSELAPLAKTLNEESNDLNKTIAALNRHLASLNLGIEVWCGPWDEDTPFQIGYAKVEDGINSKGTATWELATRSCTPIQKEDEHGYLDWEAKPGSLGTPQCLLRASRNVRVDGLEVMPQIIGALKARAESKIATIQRAKKLAAELSEPPGPPKTRTITVHAETEAPKTRTIRVEATAAQWPPVPTKVQAEMLKAAGAMKAMSRETEMQAVMRKAAENLSKIKT